MRRFVQLNVALSRWVDARLFRSMAVDGNRTFCDYVRAAIPDDSTLVDIGGGKRPLLSPAEVAVRRVRVTGVDIDQAELVRAPEGAYAQAMVADITLDRGKADADYVVAQSLLEHVRSGAAAIEGMVSYCRPGGRIFLFCPNRRAWFAVLNRWLPERAKRAVLYAIYPQTRDSQGFPAYYDGCTPAETMRALRAAGARVLQVRPHFVSSYFMFFFPLYLFWRVCTYPFMRLAPHAFCETFWIEATRDADGSDARGDTMAESSLAGSS